MNINKRHSSFDSNWEKVSDNKSPHTLLMLAVLILPLLIVGCRKIDNKEIIIKIKRPKIEAVDYIIAGKVMPEINTYVDLNPDLAPRLKKVTEHYWQGKGYMEIFSTNKYPKNGDSILRFNEQKETWNGLNLSWDLYYTASLSPTNPKILLIAAPFREGDTIDRTANWVSSIKIIDFDCGVYNNQYWLYDTIYLGFRYVYKSDTILGWIRSDQTVITSYAYTSEK